MSITIELSDQEIAALKQLTKLDDGPTALAKAAREFVRLARLRELKGASGKVDFESNWEQLETLELDESPLPQ